MPAFTDLPIELLQLIAGKCPPPDILTLGRTCRRLHEACDGISVLQASFESYFPELTSTTFKNKNALVRFMHNYADSPARRDDGLRKTWLCLAMVAYRFPDAMSELQRLLSCIKAQRLSHESEELLRGILAFLSTLPVWGYTEACNPVVAEILDCLGPFILAQHPGLNALRIDESIGSEHPIQFAFCLVLSHLETERPPGLQNQPGVRQSHGVFIYQHFALVKSFYGGIVLGPRYNIFQHSWTGKQTLALLLIDLIARNIRYLTSGRYSPFTRLISLGSLPKQPDATIQLPNPKRIEFIDSQYLPPSGNADTEEARWEDGTSSRPRFPLLTPSLAMCRGGRGRYFHAFVGDDWWSWYTTRVRDLTRRLDEGEWYCVYADNLQEGNRDSLPIERIQFKKISPDGVKYLVEATGGSDRTGAFTLRGEVDASDAECTLRLQKIYTSHVHDWRGQVTPLGICGSAHNPSGPDARRAVGYFWLFKRDWIGDVDELRL
ncbi:hypothetical protein M426DRAFT_324919 [Hypoxylon sp. CI-4A]|nr:hypothetical protein M426DRAFT_324919 [Hypoxylon sp. CI-4A]